MYRLSQSQTCSFFLIFACMMNPEIYQCFDIVNKQVNLYEIVLFKRHKITCFLIKYSHVEQSCFPRMMTLVSTTTVTSTSSEVLHSPSSICCLTPGERASIYTIVYHGENKIHFDKVLEIYHTCKNIDISRGSSYKHK
jgi:hypothetical protein